MGDILISKHILHILGNRTRYIVPGIYHTFRDIHPRIQIQGHRSRDKPYSHIYLSKHIPHI